MAPEDIPNAHDVGFTAGQPEEVIIKVLGVGGGGNNAVSHMYKQNIRNVSFAVLNTDRKALNHSPVPTKIQIGNGLGAGNVPEVARLAAEDAKDQIADLFNDSTKMVFITAGMGGGTGTGAAPVVARIAREKGLLTIGIVTIPFLFEGERKILKALNGADEMSKYVDAMLVINNQRLNEIYPDLNLVNAFGKADDTLTTAARSISELINSEAPRINLDFNDVDSTLRDGGAAIISTGYGEGPGRVTKAINDALNSPLLKNRDILTSKRLLFNIFFNPEAEQELKTEETEELTSFISSIDRDVDVIWGMAYDRDLGDTVKITILASGFSISVDDAHSHDIGSGAHKLVFANKNTEISERESTDKLRGEYGDEAVNRFNAEKAKARYIVLKPSQMDDDKFIDAFEKSPTYNREKKTADEIKAIGQTGQAAVSETTACQQQRQPNSDTTIKFK
ncbi:MULTISPECIES: cell division protein FtsZ [Muribaculum]|jgi:cell division protein FtsZ|uniref:Cell division protein FtsZ n=1 Tax=Muribaculum caecicola TaxID=3038144 RepID=A0AC61S649_9BACT|nr:MULTISPECIES: cell division protein FtsZ [Muribaculum]THG50759.1 cell division protein FtsZ [Muribaculum caecicola]